MVLSRVAIVSLLRVVCVAGCACGKGSGRVALSRSRARGSLLSSNPAPGHSLALFSRRVLGVLKGKNQSVHDRGIGYFNELEVYLGFLVDQ